MKNVKAKKKGYGLEIKTFPGKNGTYVVFRTIGKGATYHTFIETEAKDAAIDCGSKRPRSDHMKYHWDELWNKTSQSK